MTSSRSISSPEKARGSRVRTFSAPSSVPSRVRIGTARIDWYSSSGRLGKCLKRGSRWASAASITGAHARPPCHALDLGAVRCTQHELVGPLVVQVDEARIRLERAADLRGNRCEHPLEVERG